MPEDPVWTYFDAQHKFILDQMKKAYQLALTVVECMFLPAFGILTANCQLRETRRGNSTVSRVAQTAHRLSVENVHSFAQVKQAGAGYTYASRYVIYFPSSLMLFVCSAVWWP